MKKAAATEVNLNAYGSGFALEESVLYSILASANSLGIFVAVKL